jgi:hypothetical protein
MQGQSETAGYLSSRDHVHAVQSLSTGSILVVTKASHTNDVKAFETLRENGYRVGAQIPSGDGNTWLFVPMDGDADGD